MGGGGGDDDDDDEDYDNMCKRSLRYSFHLYLANKITNIFLITPFSNDSFLQCVTHF